MKIGITAMLLFLLIFPASQASALSHIPTQPIAVNSGLMITAYSTSIGQTSLDFVQIHNTNDGVVSLNGWQLGYVATPNTTPQALLELSGYMKAKSHAVYTQDATILEPGVYPFSFPQLSSGEKLTKIVLIAPGTGTANLELPITASDGTYKRGLTSTGYSSSSSFSKLSEPVTLYADEQYILPGSPPLRIVEIVARHAECAPNDISVVCSDYIKLQNKSEEAIDVSLYRVRSDSGTSETSNAYSLSGVLGPSAYMTVSVRDDGEKLSLTDSGGFVWIEDAAGLVKFYDETMTQYPSASSVSKIGWAWALDTVDTTWKWTSTPQPSTQNIISAPTPVVIVPEEPSECPAGKYRNPETNRCRSLEDAVNILGQCDEGKERNPVTNRCRSLASVASAVLEPCDEGKERNPATNRCRSVLASTSSQLQLCKIGYERNPTTNRCRKTLAPALSATASPRTTPSNGSSFQTTALIVAGLGALGYGVYEWRSELLRGLRRVRSVTRK